MPPRIAPPHVKPYICPQCIRTRPAARREVSVPITSTHQFSSTSPNATRLRRNMFAWLHGPGKAFRRPLPASSNYLSAYDRQGQLLRQKQAATESMQGVNDEVREDEDEEALVTQDRANGLSEEDVQRRAEQRERTRSDRQEMEARKGIPKETARDLRPYPLNREFRSQPVLSEELRQEIYKLITESGVDLKAVSAAFGVDVRRVAAVVRLIALEKQWIQQGKALAKPYSKAVLAMLPTTPYRENLRTPPPHEPINDLPVHPYTRHQIFVPTSESRAFTREDAAKTFHPTLLPADERIAHPELIQIAKWENEGHDRETRHRLMREKDAEVAMKRAYKEKKQREWEKRTQVVVPGRRWDFKFQDISAERTGKDGRGQNAVGVRYGMPHEDRKKGQVKIPTKVE